MYVSFLLLFETIVIFLIFILVWLRFGQPFKFIFFSLLGSLRDQVTPVYFAEDPKICHGIECTCKGWPNPNAYRAEIKLKNHQQSYWNTEYPISNTRYYRTLLLLTGCSDCWRSNTLCSIKNNKEVKDEPCRLYVDNYSIDVGKYCNYQILKNQ